MALEPRTLDQHLDPKLGPKRILTLDGGGIRGAMTLEYLAGIEDLLRKRQGGDPAFRLCHYFDLIGGTSTGAIIAACLALGKSVDEVREAYEELGHQVFQRRFWRLGVFKAKFDAEALEAALRYQLGENTTLGGSELLTGLLVVLKRFDTGSPWPLTNNPEGTFYRDTMGEGWFSNADYPLWRVVRASTAAPSYFKPVELIVEPGGKPGTFVDGGVSTANNPSLQALQVVLLDGFRWNWRPGDKELLLISVGTGRTNPERIAKRIAGQHALESLLALMEDCSTLVETQMQWLSQSSSAREIDIEIGNLQNDLLTERPLLTYHRYDVEFSQKWIGKNLPEAGLSDRQLTRLSAMDDPRNISLLQDVGRMAGAKQIDEQHFPAGFDLR